MNVKLAIAAALVAALTGCATSSILVGTQRPPIDPSQVRVYLDPPPQFEKVAMLEADSRGIPAFSPQRSTNAVVARMKAEAAKLGANGLLIQGMGNQSAGSVGSYSGNAYGNGFSGIGISSNIMIKTGAALAIYVQPGAATQPVQTQAAPITPPGSSTPAAEPCASCEQIGKGF